MQNISCLVNTHPSSNPAPSNLLSRHHIFHARIQPFLHKSPDPTPIAKQLQAWLSRQLSPAQSDWINQTLDKLATDPSDRVFMTRFSATPRQVGKDDLALTTEDLQTAHRLHEGWTPRHWSVDQATRTLLLLSFSKGDAYHEITVLARLFAAADVAEQVSLYQSLPLLPYPEYFVDQAIEGLRSNITPVFNAIALHNPYPADYFEEAAWNQMVLKALFVDSPLSHIQGLDVRANVKLAQMLGDYAHERWAAGRPVNPQLWRLVGPFSNNQLVADLERVLCLGTPHEQQAAALACASAPTPAAQALLDKVPALKIQIANQDLTWTSFSCHHD